jgi:hypothetical protein
MRSVVRQNANMRGLERQLERSVKVFVWKWTSQQGVGRSASPIAQASTYDWAVRWARESDKLIDIVLRQPLDERQISRTSAMLTYRQQQMSIQTKCQIAAPVVA